MNKFKQSQVMKLLQMMETPPAFGQWMFCVACHRPYWSDPEGESSWGDVEHAHHLVVPVPRLFKDEGEKVEHLRGWLNQPDCSVPEESRKAAFRAVKEGFREMVECIQYRYWQRYLAYRHISIIQPKLRSFFLDIQTMSGEEVKADIPVSPKGEGYMDDEEWFNASELSEF